VYTDILLNADFVQEEVDKEKITFAKAIGNIDEIFEKDVVVKSLVNTGEIVQKFINYLQYGGENKAEVKTMRLCLEALGNFITVEKKDEEKMVEKQNFLNEKNATYMLISQLSSTSKDRLTEELFSDLLDFAIKLLEVI
jgi:hypothetical protein